MGTTRRNEPRVCPTCNRLLNPNGFISQDLVSLCSPSSPLSLALVSPCPSRLLSSPYSSRARARRGHNRRRPPGWDLIFSDDDSRKFFFHPGEPESQATHARESASPLPPPSTGSFRIFGIIGLIILNHERRIESYSGEPAEKELEERSEGDGGEGKMQVHTRAREGRAGRDGREGRHA